MAGAESVLLTWGRLAPLPGGKWLFSRPWISPRKEARARPG